MHIELKNVKYAAFASEETHCFTASVYLDGVKSGEVSNDGHGGADRFHPQALFDRLEAYAKTMPPNDVSYLYNDGAVHMSPQSAEGLIGNLMNRYLTVKDNKRLCKGKTVYRLPSHTYKEGEYHTTKVEFSPEVKAKFVAKHGPTIWFLNEHIED